jgi:hypothetical protein
MSCRAELYVTVRACSPVGNDRPATSTVVVAVLPGAGGDDDK